MLNWLTCCSFFRNFSNTLREVCTKKVKELCKYKQIRHYLKGSVDGNKKIRIARNFEIK